MKKIGVGSWKNYPHMKCLSNIFAKFPRSKNNHVYSIRLYLINVIPLI